MMMIGKTGAVGTSEFSALIQEYLESAAQQAGACFELQGGA